MSFRSSGRVGISWNFLGEACSSHWGHRGPEVPGCQGPALQAPSLLPAPAALCLGPCQTRASQLPAGAAQGGSCKANAAFPSSWAPSAPSSLLTPPGRVLRSPGWGQGDRVLFSEGGRRREGDEPAAWPSGGGTGKEADRSQGGGRRRDKAGRSSLSQRHPGPHVDQVGWAYKCLAVQNRPQIVVSKYIFYWVDSLKNLDFQLL